jgi:hypothetical protein
MLRRWDRQPLLAAFYRLVTVLLPCNLLQGRPEHLFYGSWRWKRLLAAIRFVRALATEVVVVDRVVHALHEVDLHIVDARHDDQAVLLKLNAEYELSSRAAWPLSASLG